MVAVITAFCGGVGFVDNGSTYCATGSRVIARVVPLPLAALIGVLLCVLASSHAPSHRRLNC